MYNKGSIVDRRPSQTYDGKPVCWVAGDVYESCNIVCATAGLQAYSYCAYYDPGCTLSKKMFIHGTTACDEMSSVSVLAQWYNAGGNYKTTTSRALSGGSCSVSSSLNNYLCPCRYDINNFNYNFTPSF